MIRKNKWIYVFIVFTLIFMSLPFAAAQAAVSGTDLEQLFNKFNLKNNGNWYKDYNNENGALAWDESYVMRAYLEMYQTTKDTQYLDKFIVHGDSVLKQRDSERGVKDYRGLSLPAWRGGTRYTQNGTYKIFDVHTAMIAYPYAQFATIVNKSSALSAYKSYADKYLKAAKDAVAVHDGEWTETATEMYLGRPFNMTLSLGSVYLEIYQASGDVTYKNKGVKIATHFKNNLTLDSATNSYLWKYMLTRDYGWEDLSHGAIDMDFAYLAYKNNIFNATDIQRFGNTTEKKMIKTDGNIANRVDGSGTGANQSFIGLWLNFHPWAPSLFDTAYIKVSAITAPQGEDLLSAGLLNKVYRERNGGLPDPTPIEDTTAPLVTKKVPEANAVVHTGVSLSVTFNEPVQNVTVENLFIEGITGQVKYDGATKTAVFTPANALEEDTTYNAVLTSGITDMAGNKLTNTTWTFKTAVTPPSVGVMVNGNFSSGKTGWSGTEVSLKSETNGNQYGLAPYGWAFYQDLELIPGEYKLNAKTLKGTSTTEARVVVAFFDAAGKRTVAYGNLYKHKGTGWEALPEQIITIPKSAVTTRIYLLTNGGSGVHGFDDVSLESNVVEPIVPSVLVNGNFTSGKTGWSGTGVNLKSETNGNQYGLAPYGWAFYQDMKLAPGEYKLNAKTLKGTSTTEARVVVAFFDAAGKRTVAYGNLYKHKGTGWEALPEQIITVPKSAVTTRIYLLTNGGSGVHGFDDISLKSNVVEPTVPSIMVNGNFSGGTTGWSGANISVKNEANGNKYASAVYGWAFYQELSLAPGQYKFNAKTKKGTSATEARIVVMYIDGAGKRTVGHEITYKHFGTGWETIPELAINVPNTAVSTRIYLLNNGGTGYHGFDDISLVK